MTAASKTLRLTNHDSQPVSVDPQFSEALMSAGAAAADVWALDLPACVLQPGQSAEGAISFKPGAESQYALRIPLEINGLYRVSVDVQGEGVPVRVEPLDANHRTVAFGAVGMTGLHTGEAPTPPAFKTSASVSTVHITIMHLAGQGREYV
jgi:hypothetical protein